MSALRQKMMEDMQLRGLSERTQELVCASRTPISGVLP